MIGKLTGTIDTIGEDYVLLDVNGVGYIVFASRASLQKIGGKGEVSSLLIETQVREDSITLFGFASAQEQKWFNLLTSVQGVGAKVGLKILSVCPPDQLNLAIAAQDKAIVQQADGVGPKLATRIVTELKDKAANLSVANDATNVASMATSSGGAGAGDINHDAISALVNLGYQRGNAFQAVSVAQSKADDPSNLQDIIRLSLKELAS